MSSRIQMEGRSAMRPLTTTGVMLETGLSAAAATLLKLMSTRDGWHPDELQTRCVMRVSEVTCALLELELTGLVHNGVRGYRTVEPALHS